MRRPQLAALGLAAAAGVSAWVSYGTLAVVNQNGARVGTLPPLWSLAACVLAAIGVSLSARLRLSESWPLTVTWLVWLPWLALRVPAPALIWDGPLEALLWLAAVSGVVVARTAGTIRACPAMLSAPSRAPWTVAAVFFVCSIASAAALRSQLPGGDEPHYLVITQSLLYDGDLQIENNHERGDYFEYTPNPIRPDFLRRGTNGRIYSVHAPGVSALVLPGYAIAGYPGTVVILALLTALSAAGLWRIAFELTQEVSAAWVAVLGVGFSATYFLHSFTIFPDPVCGAFVTFVLLTLVRIETSPASVTTRQLVMTGATLAALPWLHTRFVLVAATLGAVIAVRLLPGARGAVTADNGRERPPWPRIAALVAIPAMSAASWFLFFLIIYGTPNPSAPYGGSRQNALEWIPTGLTGLAFDQQFGVIANAPLLGLAPYGLFLLWRSRPRLAFELLLVVVPYVLVVASFGMWWGGWSAPARFLTCLTPLAAPATAMLWARTSVATRSLIVALTAMGLLNAGARVVLAGGSLLYNFRDGFDLLLDWSSRSVNLPLAFPSVHRVGPALAAQLALVWALAGAIALLLLRLVMNRRPMSAGARWGLTVWAVVLSGSVGLAAAWRDSLVRPVTVESSEIDLIQRWRPDRRPLAVSLPSLRVLTNEEALGLIDLETSSRARDMTDPQALLALPRLPAGEYRLVAEGARELDGVLTVFIGTTSQAVEEWSLAGRHAGDIGFRLSVPTLVRSITIRADARASGLLSRLALRPDRVLFGGAVDERHAARAARYGRTRAFFLDDGLFMESGGVWTHGDSTGEVVLTHDAGSLATMNVIAGPVAAVTELEGPAGVQEISLQPGEQRSVSVAPGLWKVTTRGSFRPKDFDPQNQDARSLGVRLEFPD